jgi:hypothetical protein
MTSGCDTEDMPGLRERTGARRRWAAVAVLVVMLVPAHWSVAPHLWRGIGGGTCVARAEGWSPWPLALSADERQGDGPAFSYHSEDSCSSAGAVG